MPRAARCAKSRFIAADCTALKRSAFLPPCADAISGCTRWLITDFVTLDSPLTHAELP
jgi:hypothetical protein